MRDNFFSRGFPAFAPAVLAIGAVGVLAAAGAPLAGFGLCLAAVGVLALATGVFGGRAPRLAAFGFAAAVLSAIVVLAAGGPALAADGAVTVPWGDYLTAVLAALAPAIGAIAIAAWRAASFLPPFIKVMLSEQLLNRSLDAGLARVANAAHGKTLDIPIANKVLLEAAQYALDNGAPWILKYIGDLGPKLVARMSAAKILPAKADAMNLYLDPTKLSR